MKVLIYDHAGHPFQVQLSRSLAKKGHIVLHTYSTLLQTSIGSLRLKQSDPEAFDVVRIFLGKSFSLYSVPVFSRKNLDFDWPGRLTQ